MCRNQAQQLSVAFAKVPKGNLAPVRLVAIVRESDDGEIDGFSRFWPHEIVFDSDSRFYRGMFDGTVRRTSVVQFAVDAVNPWSSMRQSFRQAKSGDVGDDHNLKGDGFTHGGLCVVAARGQRVLYEFAEEHIGNTPDPLHVVKSSTISVL